jgi:hypothetical protein
MANIVTPGVGLPWWDDAARQWLLWGVSSATIAIAVSAAFRDGLQSLGARTTRWLIESPRTSFVVVLASLSTVLAIYAGWALFHLQPVAGDEFVQRWQAALYTRGHLYARPEVLGEFFNGPETVVRGDRWFSQFPVGGQAFVAVGLLIHAPWLVNPVACGIAAIAVYDFCHHAFDETTARVAALLTATSPFVFFMAGTQLNETPTMALLWVAVAALARWSQAGPETRAMCAAGVLGFCIAAAATVRPYDAALFAIPIGGFQLAKLVSRPRLYRSLLVQVICGLIPLGVLFAVNTATTGAPLRFAYELLNGSSYRPGFHMTPGGFSHTPLRGLYMASAYLMKLDIALLGWPVPAMVLVAAGMLSRARVNMWDALLAAMIGVVVAGYALFWAESYYIGARYLSIIAPAFLVFVAKALLRVPKRGVPVALTWFIMAWVWPYRESQAFGVKNLVAAYRARATGPVILDAVKRASLSRALVFVPEGLHGRLAARLRADGMPNFATVNFVVNNDACLILDALTKADMMPKSDLDVRVAYITSSVATATTSPAQRLSSTGPSEQVALRQDRAPSAECAPQLAPISTHESTLAELMPYQDYEADGTLGGNIVFARDLGLLNERLRARFGDRSWYRVMLSGNDSTLVATVLPY